MRLLFFTLLLSAIYAKSDTQMVDELVESTIGLVSRNLKSRVSKWLDQITTLQISSKNELSEYLQETFIDPTLVKTSALIRREINQVLEGKLLIHPLKIFYSMSDKIIHTIQKSAFKWTQDQKYKMPQINNESGLRKRQTREDSAGYRFPHLFDNPGLLSGLVDWFFYTTALFPLYNMFDNTLQGNFYLWLIQNFMVSPVFNRLMYGYYFYQADEYEYF
jgi:hypothetical protein